MRAGTVGSRRTDRKWRAAAEAPAESSCSELQSPRSGSKIADLQSNGHYSKTDLPTLRNQLVQLADAQEPTSCKCLRLPNKLSAVKLLRSAHARSAGGSANWTGSSSQQPQ